jgi:membrane protease YdiL (CAAX protease family)
VRPPDIFVPDLPADAEVEPAPARHRRRVTAAVTLVAGAALLAATLRVPRGSTAFTVLGLLVAATWIVGAFVSGPIALRPRHRTPPGAVIRAAVGVGVASFLAFLGASLVARHVPVLSGALDSILGKADAGPVGLVLAIALVNAVAEELFFRGGLYAALAPHRPVASTTVVYVAVTATTGNLALVVAALVMGTVFGLERRATRSVLASLVTHAVWSTLILVALPR